MRPTPDPHTSYALAHSLVVYLELEKFKESGKSFAPFRNGAH